ncbi:MAG TPA: recombination protein RecR [Bacteroidetes bacterium]|nr:recombination protein RecR [Bacteroidota bacterium]
MEVSHFPSKLLEEAVEAFAGLPGIGKKTALRLVLFLLRQDKNVVEHFGQTINRLKKEIRYCKSCNNISDKDICDICANPHRDHTTVCVVENPQDVMAVENTGQYHGIYHVLGGLISPVDGIGPDDLILKPLENKIHNGEVKEIILALSTTMEGDTTNFYLYKKFKDYPVKITTLARGVSVGGELEYADEVTLGRSIANRTLFQDVFKL